MALRQECSTPGIIAFCDDIRERAPKQTALAVRYLLEIASNPRQPSSKYHQAIVGEDSYSHGNTIIRGLVSLQYLRLITPGGDGSEDLIELTPTWKKTLSTDRNTNNKTRDRGAMDIQITTDAEESQLILTTPYHPDMPAQAKASGGKWNGEAWVFPVAAGAEVRRFCLDIYGDDGTPQPRVTVRCMASDTLMNELPAKSVFLAGRKVASTKGVEKGVILGESIKVLEGGFIRKKTEKGADVTTQEGTVFEIRDLPELAANRLKEKAPSDVTLVTKPQAPASGHTEEAPTGLPATQHVDAPSQATDGLVPALRESLQAAREDIMRLCDTHGLPWPEEELARYQRSIDMARISELSSRKG